MPNGVVLFYARPVFSLWFCGWDLPRITGCFWARLNTIFQGIEILVLHF